MAITAHFIVTGLTTQGDQTTLNLTPDYNEENDGWAVGTPSASLNMVVNSTAAADFEYGQMVEVTLTPGEVPQD